MRTSLLSYFLLSLCALVHAEPKYPVDISYMVSDFKYSQEHGLKICEVQQGVVSTVKGDLYILGGDGSISPMIARFFDHFPIKKWATGSIYPPLRRSLAAKGWGFQRSIRTLSTNPEFLEYATLPPADPSSITSYAGIVYATSEIVNNFDSYRNAYPGMLFMDAAVLPYWVDKYKMNALFNLNPELKEYKADWELYPKKYDPLLAERIQEKLPSEFYVIKPRREFLGRGVIVVANTDLDGVLQMILEPKASLRRHPDDSYSYWWKNRDDSFLIERYYKSDYLLFSHKLSEKADALISDNEEGYHYDATMRIVFILKYDEGKMTYHSLGGFWKLPCKALEEKGTLNERGVSICEPPFYRAVDPELLTEIDAKMERAMLLLYEIMLNEPKPEGLGMI